MQLKPFLLDMWLATYEHDIEFNLASSEGPRWTLNQILSLASEEERQRFLNHKLAYSRPAGADGLRAAIADMHDVLDAVHRHVGYFLSRDKALGLAADIDENTVALDAYDGSCDDVTLFEFVVERFLQKSFKLRF